MPHYYPCRGGRVCAQPPTARSYPTPVGRLSTGSIKYAVASYCTNPICDGRGRRLRKVKSELIVLRCSNNNLIEIFRQLICKQQQQPLSRYDPATCSLDMTSPVFPAGRYILFSFHSISFDLPDHHFRPEGFPATILRRRFSLDDHAPTPRTRIFISHALSCFIPSPPFSSNTTSNMNESSKQGITP